MMARYGSRRQAQTAVSAIWQAFGTGLAAKTHQRLALAGWRGHLGARLGRQLPLRHQAKGGLGLIWRPLGRGEMPLPKAA
jgi:hypothetical protein